MNDAELSQASSERLNCTYGVPWVPEDDAIANGVCGIGTEDDADRPPTYEEDPSFYDEHMSLLEEAGYPVEYTDEEIAWHEGTEPE